MRRTDCLCLPSNVALRRSRNVDSGCEKLHNELTNDVAEHLGIQLVRISVADVCRQARVWDC